MHRRLTALSAGVILALAGPSAARASAGGTGLGTTPTTPASGTPATGVPTGTGGRSAALSHAMTAGMREAGVYSGAEVADLSTGNVLYSHNATVGRLPASVEKLFTTTTALERFGPGAHFTTTLLGTGDQVGATWRGTLYLRGGGDPTFGTAAFDHAEYGTGATVQSLVAGLKAQGITSVSGPIVADASRFDSETGTPTTHGRLNTEVEGGLSALAFNRDWADDDGSILYHHPAVVAAQGLVAALRAAGIRVPKHVAIRTGRTPAGAHTLASVQSPPLRTLIELTNTPSDNFFAETLLKDIGASFGGAGTTAAGAAVVRTEMSADFGITPRLDDGSGLSRYDRTTPAEVVDLLAQMEDDTPFTNSLAVTGLTGTLVDENRHTYAQGRCTGKTGTLHDVSNMVGYCRARDGHLLAYAFLMNGVDPYAAHPIQDRMQVAVARYDG